MPEKASVCRRHSPIYTMISIVERYQKSCSLHYLKVLKHLLSWSLQTGPIVVSNACVQWHHGLRNKSFRSQLCSRTRNERAAPALAMTTSSLPAMALISSTAATFSSLSQEVSLTTCTLPGNSLTSACRSVAAAGLRAPAKTIALSR